ncbi:hypothetical protein M011DRAFT_20788 [Sporormia fimetaria CBS 119925]|uniref:Uncharacterized protein n=1 Tax=Sporormia fimetaria CBS 119925 TaxID=1340428 RepID=A0A6A6VR65_9PLEO|nr:hypothetical protein M011DRAFT_20788 [Sporormia fimetaria CBS 119925]
MIPNLGMEGKAVSSVEIGTICKPLNLEPGTWNLDTWTHGLWNLGPLETPELDLDPWTCEPLEAWNLETWTSLITYIWSRPKIDVHTVLDSKPQYYLFLAHPDTVQQSLCTWTIISTALVVQTLFVDIGIGARCRRTWPTSRRRMQCHLAGMCGSCRQLVLLAW